MKLRVYRSDKGDCLLLTSKDGKRMLVDGGMQSSFKQHVAPELSKLKPARLDVVYVSHIDDDHISGVLALFDSLVDWRVHEFQKKNENPKHKPPKAPKPPLVKALWHNAFREQIGKNAGEITDMLAQVGSALATAGNGLGRLGQHHSDLAESTRQAVELARRAGARELGIPVNAEAKGKLMMVRPRQKPIKLGSLKVHIVGPHSVDLENLRDEWNEWLRKNKVTLTKIRASAKKNEDGIGNAAQALVAQEAKILSEVAAFTRLEAKALGIELEPGALAARAKVLGKRASVTTPNLASLMLLVEEGKTSVLLTGDGHADDVIKGLKTARKLDAKDCIHVDVLKVQHHGSEHNITTDFCEQVTADHYVFCGNGFSSNPELDVIEAIVDARVAGAGPNRAFKLWFNANPADPGKYQKHMKSIERTVKALSAKNPGRIQVKFIEKGAASMDVL